jgi:predicted alpha/beta hydrolase
MLAVTDGKPQQPYRLIVNNEKDRMDVLTIQLSTGGEALPVFSHEEEAEKFVRLGSWGAGWRAREASARELVSVLLGPCAGLGLVALDPWPEIHAEMVVGLIGVNRVDFVNLLVVGIEASRSTALGYAGEGI